MPDPVCFIDTETAGLDPERHDIWEVAIISWQDDAWRPHHWFVDIDESFADPIGLAIGRYDERHPYGRSYRNPDGRPAPEQPLVLSPHDSLTQVAELTHGLHLVGAIPSFDEERLRRAMVKHRIRPSWHYHIIDVEALAIGYYKGLPSNGFADPPLPWKSEDLSRLVGVDPDQFARHTAMGDAQWAKAIYDKVMGRA